MSEYQLLAFRTIDRPLTDREMIYARKQSNRAEITRWYFENEYHVNMLNTWVDALSLRESKRLLAKILFEDPAATKAEMLAGLREALGGDEGVQLTRKHAAHLAKKHPTLPHLKSSLRKRGLLE